MDRNHLYIIHILETIQRVEDYTREEKRDFVMDRKTYDAVLRNLQTMAESTQKLSDAVKENHPTIEWDKIAGFRNILVHDYLGDLNTDLLWEIIVRKLPALKKAMQAEQAAIKQ